MTEESSRSDEQLRGSSRRRWTPVFWIVEVTAIVAIPVVVLLLQYSEEGYIRRDGVRVVAIVAGDSSTTDGCVRCRLLFTIDGERYSVEETLVAGSSSESQRRYFPGEAIEIYVDPNEVTHTIEVDAIEESIVLGVIGIAVAALIAVAWPVYEYKRPIRPSGAPAPSPHDTHGG